MKYRILEKSSAYKLQIEVNELIAQGWRPQGGVTIDSQGMSESFLQAMVKEEQAEGCAPISHLAYR
jgi:hypothetical protein